MKELELALQNANDIAEFQATHDALTGLPNHVLLVDRISQAISRAKRKNELVAVLTIDIDKFSRLNEIYGYAEGNRLLMEISARTQKSMREHDTVSRLGGDEFILLTTGMTSVEQVQAIAERLLENVRQPFLIENKVITPTISLGIALYPAHGTTPDTLRQNSDRALFQAKKLGKGRYVFADGM